MVTVAFCAPAAVEMEKVPLVLPAATVTLPGTLAVWGLLLARVTVVVSPAGASKVTVPVAVVPPLTVVGFTVSEDRAGCADWLAVTVSVAERVTPA